MNDLNYIIETMKQERDAVGFIPSTTLNTQYIQQSLYLIQRNRLGLAVGYLLHSKPKAGKPFYISQALIDVDRRNLGFGESVVLETIKRAKTANSQYIKLRCAEDLAANEFWKALGFVCTKIEYPDNQRKRAINTYIYDLWPLLFESLNSRL